jgi:hypothetical protein
MKTLHTTLLPQDVAVNVVGKYLYQMASPSTGTSVPLVVDIILVGRTKVITLHSAMWVENGVDRPITLRLHVPTTSLVPPQSSGGGGGGDENSVIIGPLNCGAGCYLPLTAALGGLLFVTPEGYHEATRDVVRLGSDVSRLLTQQGFIACEPRLPSLQEGPLHLSMRAAPSRPLSEFQAFKHLECVAPGTIQLATRPLEVALTFAPTMVLRNALPYEMRVLVWQATPGTESGGGRTPQTTTTAVASSPSFSFLTLSGSVDLQVLMICVSWHLFEHISFLRFHLRSPRPGERWPTCSAPEPPPILPAWAATPAMPCPRAPSRTSTPI